MTLAVVALSLSVAYASRASGSLISSDELIRQSSVIVYARIESVHDSGPNGGDVRTVTARVQFVWKGDSRLWSVTFLAPQGEPNDLAGSLVGDNVILFLHEGHQADADLQLSGGWSGCMPLHQGDGKQYAAVSSDVVWPPDVPVLPISATGLGFTRSVSVRELRELVRSAVPSGEAPTSATNTTP